MILDSPIKSAAKTVLGVLYIFCGVSFCSIFPFSIITILSVSLAYQKPHVGTNTFMRLLVFLYLTIRYHSGMIFITIIRLCSLFAMRRASFHESQPNDRDSMA